MTQQQQFNQDLIENEIAEQAIADHTHLFELEFEAAVDEADELDAFLLEDQADYYLAIR